jgi:hypothetical protein
MNLTPLQKQKLISIYPELRQYFDIQDIKERRTEADGILIALINKIQSLKGEKGDLPIKGKDYFTPQEAQMFLKYVIDTVYPVVLKQATPVKGVHYKDGENYVLTASDKKEIASQIDVPIVEKVIEKTEVIKEVSRKLTVNDIKDAVSKKELEIEKKSILDGMAKVDGRIKLIDQRWHGGGLSKVSTDATLTGNGTSSSPLHAVGSSGTWYQDEVPSGTKNGVNMTFTLAHTPTSVVLLYLNGQYQVSGGADYSRSGTTITMTTAPLSTDTLVATYS